MSEAGELAASAGNALVGLIVLFAFPAILAARERPLRRSQRPAWRSERGRSQRLSPSARFSLC